MGLDLVELVMSLEQSFGIDLPKNIAEKTRTPADLIAFFSEEIKKRPGDQIRVLVAEIVRVTTIAQLGIKPKVYREDARFVEDFGAD